MNIGEKIRAIRETEGLTRQAFENKTDIKLETLSKVERNLSKLTSDKLQAICVAFPQYTLWLMTDTVNIEAGQISPYTKYKEAEINQSQAG